MNACETAPQVIAETIRALGPGVKSRPSLQVLSHVSYRVEKKPKKLTQVGARIARPWILTQEHGSHFRVRKARSIAVYMRRIPIGHRTAYDTYGSYTSMELVQAAEQWL